MLLAEWVCFKLRQFLGKNHRKTVNDPVALAKLRESWKRVRQIQDQIARNLASASSGVIGGGVSNEFRNLSYSVAVLFAFSVLEDTLKQLAKEGVLNPRNHGLKRLMKSSKKVLPWVDYRQVNKGRKDRNKIAHMREFFPRGKCWGYINAIEQELTAWQVLKGQPINKDH